MKVLLSIVLPVYNGEKYLMRTLKHLARIGCRSMEILLIDDGSLDQSGNICQVQAACDKRFRYIRQEHGGIAAARNTGVRLAEGRYIGFCDQDDRLLPRGYFALLSKMEKNDAQIGICSTERMIGGRRSPYEKLTDAVYRGDEVQRGLLYPLLFRGYAYSFVPSGNYLYGTLWKCIFRADWIRDHHLTFRAFVAYEDDWLFVTQALSLARNAVSVSASGYCWRVEADSESHRRMMTENLMEKLDCLDDFLCSCIGAEIKTDEIFREFQKVNLCGHYMSILKSGNDLKGIRQYLQRTDYRRQISCRKYLKRSAWHERILLNALWAGGVQAAYVVCRVYDCLERNLGKIQWVVRIERRCKIL